MSAPQPPGDQPGNDQLQRENQVLKEQLDAYRHLEEDLASHRVFEKARKQLISWVTLGGTVFAVLGFFGLKQIYDLAATTATTHAQQEAQELAELRVDEILTESLILQVVDEKISSKLDGVDAQIQQASAEIEDARAQIQGALQQIDLFRSEVGSIRGVLSEGAQPQKPVAYAPPDMAASADAWAALDGEPLPQARAEDDTADAVPESAPETAPPVAQLKTAITFANRSGTTVDVYWIGYGGQEVPYARLAPEETYEQETYVTHPWVVRTADDGRKIGSVVAGLKPVTFEITPGLIEKAQAAKAEAQ